MAFPPPPNAVYLDRVSYFGSAHSKLLEESKPLRINDFTDTQYMAWSMYGVISVMNTLWWLQNYYYMFWMGDTVAALNFYSWWGISEFFNIIFLIVQWLPTALVWMLTVTDVWELTYFFVAWNSLMHYVSVIRYVVVNVTRLMALFHDVVTDTYSYSGLDHSYQISMQHSMNYWDFWVDWLGLLSTFSFYSELETIVDPKYTAKIQAQNSAMNANLAWIQTPEGQKAKLQLEGVTEDLDAAKADLQSKESSAQTIKAMLKRRNNSDIKQKSQIKDLKIQVANTQISSTTEDETI